MSARNAYSVRRYPIHTTFGPAGYGLMRDTTGGSLISSNSETVNDSTAMPWLSGHYDILCNGL